MENCNIFVALTKDQTKWNKSNNIVLLGHWCLENFDNQSKFNILEHPIKTNNSSYLEFDQINRELYSKYLFILSDQLNEVHGTNYSVRYWDIVLGSFLYRYIGVMRERFLTIQNLIDRYSEFDCAMTKVCNEEATFFDELSFMRSVQDENFNLKLYSKILHFFKKDGEIVELQEKDYENSRRYSCNFFKKLAELIFLVIAYLKKGKIRKTILMKNPYLNVRFLLKLAIFSKYRVKIKFCENYENLLNQDTAIRKRIRENLPDQDNFEAFLRIVLPFDIPMSLIENYKYLNDEVVAQYPKSDPDIIYSANSWYYDELFKLWSAKLSGKSKIIGVQHGGNYGVSRYLLEEKYEVNLADFYLTWGWKKKDYKNLIPFGSTKMLHHKRINSYSDEILFVMTDLPTFFFDLRYVPLSRIDYQENQRIFLANISNKLLDKFRIRPYPSDSRDYYIKFWKSYSENVKVDSKSEKFIDSLNNCKLFVTDHLMTTYLESLKLNIPTIIYLDKTHPNGLIDYSMIGDFSKLKDVGILFFSAKSAAIAINKIYDDVDGWWLSPQVQNARKEFCEKFALDPGKSFDNFDNLFDKVSPGDCTHK